MSSSNPGPAITTSTNAQLALTPPNGTNQYYTNTATAAVTVLAAQLMLGDLVTLNMTGTLGAGANLTTDTATNFAAALIGTYNVPPTQTISYVLRIVNSSSGAFSWTVVGGTGVTVNGTATVAQNTWREFLMTITANTVTMQSIGTGTYS